MTASEALETELGKFLGDIIARSAVIHASRRCGVSLERMKPGDSRRLLAELERSVRLYISDHTKRRACISHLSEVLAGPKPETCKPSVYEIAVKTEQDLVTARNVGRDLCSQIGFSATDQIRVATVISELARNILLYASCGAISFAVLHNPRAGIAIVARDQGRGIPNLEEIMAGRYVSRTGMGRGLLGVKRLVDIFSIQTGPNGTEVSVQKLI